jgi:hypothetical protein
MKKTIIFTVILIMTSCLYAQAYFTGDGGSGIKLAVLEPIGNGFAPSDQWMLSLIQGSITSDLTKYTAITVIDRQNQEQVFKNQNLALTGRFSDEDALSVTKMINAN